MLSHGEHGPGKSDARSKWIPVALLVELATFRNELIDFGFQAIPMKLVLALTAWGVNLAFHGVRSMRKRAFREA
jgi:hypothetical protein